VQLIVGTLSQTVGAVSKPAHEHTWQLLRFFEEADPLRLLVERTLFTRNQRTGPFMPLGGSSGSGMISEVLT
ncbi:hypothetical protein, partial [Salmonella enterica]|uniref:hypothetical protein n=1 Tax=Salmonella enterica TaxID=28901 RepID=UPI0019D54400